MNRILNEELNKMKFLFGYEKGRVISEQAQTTTQPTPKDLIVKIQTVLKDKYKQNLGPKGADGVWGNFTQTAFENVMKNLKPNATTPAAQKDLTGLWDKLKNTQQQATTVQQQATGTTTVQQPATGTTTDTTTGTTSGQKLTVQAGTPGDETSIAASQGQLTPKQIRQKARYDAGLARQNRRNERRANKFNPQQSQTSDAEDISEL